MAVPTNLYDMTAAMQNQQMVADVMSPQERFLLAAQVNQQQMGIYAVNYGETSPEEATGGQVFDVPYRGYG
jgi:hypothetical protein